MSSFFDDDEDDSNTKSKLRNVSNKKNSAASSAKASQVSTTTVHRPDLTSSSPLNDVNPFSITELDVQVAEQQRRTAVAWGGGKLGSMDGSIATPEALRASMVASMQAAQKRREHEREAAIVRKAKRDRELEANDPELVEKDLEVGVFFTDAYKAKVAEALRTRNGDVSDEKDDEDEGISRTKPAAGTNVLTLSSSSYYDALMAIHSNGSSTPPTSAPPVEEGSASGLGCSDATCSTEQKSVVITTNSASVPLTLPSRIQTTKEASEEAAVALARQRRKARESKRAMVFDDAMIAAARDRFLQRQKLRLEQHARFR